MGKKSIFSSALLAMLVVLMAVSFIKPAFASGELVPGVVIVNFRPGTIDE